MAIAAADWTFTRNATGGGVIDYIGDDHLRFGGTTPNYITVIELHRWLQDLADDAEYTGDDEIDIINVNPSIRSTDNIITLTADVTITDAAVEHLFDGTILQSSDGTRWDGIVNFGNSDVFIQVHQNGAVLTDDWWNLSAGGGLNADSTQGISHRFLIKTINAGANIDGRKLLGTARTFGKTYSEFPINGTSSGNNVFALADATDLNNGTAVGTVATWTTITNVTEGYKLLDVNNDASDEEYASEWNRDTFSINQFYERMKWLTRDGSASTIYGLNGELFRGITHEIALSGTSSGTFSAFEAISWTGGTGQMIAIDNTTAASATKMWMQILTGSPPTTELITGGTSAATATATGNTERTISAPFIGASTGSALIGAYGWGIETADLSATDKVTDLSNTVITPPNNVTFSVSGLVSTEDYVLVAPWDGVATDSDGNPEVEYDQFTQSALVNSATTTSITVGAAIPTDTPSTGTIRVQTNSGFYQLCSYTSYTGSVFTITSEDFSVDPSDGTTTPKNVFISYIDKLAASGTESFTGVYLADRDLVVKVRDGGGSPIKEFISTGSLGSTGGSVTAIRTVDV